MTGRYKIPQKPSRRKPGSNVGRKPTGIRRRNVFTIAFDDQEMSIFEQMAKIACVPKAELARKAIFRGKKSQLIVGFQKNGVNSTIQTTEPGTGAITHPGELIA